MLVTWQDFQNTCKNITVDFENMCRLFFKYHFVKNKMANILQTANNPGIETEPVLIDGARVGFQAKYFSNRPSYSDILKSANKVVEYYSGKIDKVILFCNKDLNTNTNNYIAAENLLCQNNIEMEPFCNNSILDILSTCQEYAPIKHLFFNKMTLDDEWFKLKLRKSLKDLEPRYKPDLHVDEFNIQKHFDILYRNDSVIACLQKIINDAKNKLKYINQEQALVKEVLDIIDNLFIPNNAELEMVLLWYEKFSSVITKIKQKRGVLDNRLEDFYNGKIKLDSKERNEIDSRLTPFNKLFDVIERFNLFEDAHFRFLKNNILIVEGQAGKGKSHLLGFEADLHGISEKYRSVLLLGQKFIFDNTPQEQIVQILGLSCSFNEFLQACEARGELDGGITVIMIDAINECKKYDIWKQYLNELIEEVKDYKYVRLVCSIRTTYKKYILTDKLLKEIENDEISLIEVPGFRNNLTEAIPIFFDYYNIPISTAAYFYLEFENPLFLQTYCEAYSDGIGIGSRGIFELYNAYIKKEESKVKELLSITDDISYAQKIIKVIGKFMYENNTNYITLDELYKQCQYISNCSKFIDTFLKAKVLIQYNYNDDEYVYINYERFTDYIVAKHILDNTNSYDELCSWIKKELLKTNAHGHFLRNYVAGQFAALALLAREKYNKEIIDCIKILPDVDNSNRYLLNDIVTEYLDSFMLRADKDIDDSDYYYIVNEYVRSIGTEEKHLDILIGLSGRDCSLNVNSTTQLLLQMPLNMRDYLWTCYINDKYQQGERVYYIINYFLNADLKNIANKERVLFGQIITWFLASSNRVLRDKGSRALIRLLKNDVSAMIELLKIFNQVNDPYIISRLYGCVYGAILQTKDEFWDKTSVGKLSSFIYKNIFDKQIVYIDILLRDYALNILEFCLYRGIGLDFDIEKCRPPYKSYAIPKIDVSVLKKMYPESTYDNWLGTSAIKFSMAPEYGITGFTGGYGDFGRYTFESALHEFKDVDVGSIFSYAYFFIVNNLGYNNEMFSSYDKRIGYGRGRSNCHIERIGKKYEWIAMYHILALVSDGYDFDDEFYSKHLDYKGTWCPHVRDFDPTLNIVNNNRVHDIDTVLIRNHYTNWQLQNKEWTKNDDVGSFIENIRMTDSNGNVWYALYFYTTDDTGKDYNKVRQSVWTTATACLIRKEELSDFVNKIQNRSYWGNWLRAKEVHDEYGVFAREYVWSPAYKDEFDYFGFKEVEVETGVRNVIKTIPITRYNGNTFDEWLDENSNDEDEKDYINMKYTTIEEKCEVQETIKEVIGSIMPCHHFYLWEEGCDYSKDDTIHFSMPCSFIVNKLAIKQTLNGVWQHKDDIACVDFKLIKNSNVTGLYIKEKYYRTLIEDDMAIIWIGIGEKQHTFGELNNGNQSWSEISSLVYVGENENLLERVIIEHNETNTDL